MSSRYLKTMLSVFAISLLPIVGFADDTSTPAAPAAPATNNATPAAPATDSSTPVTAPTDSNTTAPAGQTTTPSTPTDSNTTTAPAGNTNTSGSGDTFHQVCVKSWMGRLNDVKDKVDFQNFGEKYCTCAETQQPLDSNDAINHAAQVCMSRTLLEDAVDNLSDEVGLTEAKPTDFDEYCMDRWQLVYPTMDDNDKKAAANYCECAKPKLLELFKDSTQATDQAFVKAIDGVAATCSGKVGK